MSSSKVAMRYAKALFFLNSTPKKQEAYLLALKTLAQVFEKNEMFKNFIANPQVTGAQKKSVLKRAVGNKIDEVLGNFIALLLDKKRFNFLPQIAFSFDQLVKKNLSELEVTLITASPVSGALKKRVLNKLTHFYSKTILLSEVINPEIIGGLILVVGNQMWDWSVRTRLEKMKEDLLSIAV